MNTSRNSSSLRQKLFMVYHEDGILDLVVGMTLLLLSAVFALPDNAFIGLIGIPIVFYFPIKERVSIPRIGFLRITSEARSKRTMMLFLFAGLLMFLGLLVLSFFSSSISGDFIEFIRANMVFVFAGILGASLWGIAIVMNNSRFAFYAILGIVFVCVAYLVAIKIWIALALLGIIVEVVAAYFLIRFIRQYPISRES